MPLVSSAQLTAMRTAYERTLVDRCELWVKGSSQSVTGADTGTYSKNGSEFACGLELNPGNEDLGEKHGTIVWDGTIRLPFIMGGIVATNRLKVTKMDGATLTTPLVFEVVSPLRVGRAGHRVKVRKVEV